MVKTLPVWKIVVAMLVIFAMALAGFWWLKIHDFDVQLSIDEGIALLRAGGPVVFFTAMALLPAMGFPVSMFNLTAASAFEARMGMAGVIAAASVAIAVNLALTYWLARYALRPWLEQMISRTKYKIPVVAEADGAQITLLFRITPGPPFFLQSFLLGLAEVPFFTYMWISWIISTVYSAAFIVFGDAILHGKGKMAFIGVSALVALGLIVHLLRQRYGKQNP